jgi:tripartite-type tricarboxylate transporter receptor subunit TctC
MAHVARSKPDGYTIVSGSVSDLAIVPAYGVKLPFDPLRDLEPITTWVHGNMILVSPASLGVKSAQDLVAVAKAKPGQLSYGTAGPGSLTHFAGELFEKLTGTDLLDIQYKGASQALPDLIAGRTQMQFDFPPTSLPFIKDGRLVPLLTTARRRIPLLPDVPTAREAGYPELEIITWSGYLAPAGTPRSVVDRLHDVFAKALSTPEVTRSFQSMGAEPVSSTPEEFAALIRAEQVRWQQIARKTGIRAE